MSDTPGVRFQKYLSKNEVSTVNVYQTLPTDQKYSKFWLSAFYKLAIPTKSKSFGT